jgi:hypothetical protein
VGGLEPPPRKAAPEVQTFLHLLMQHCGPQAIYGLPSTFLFTRFHSYYGRVRQRASQRYS